VLFAGVDCSPSSSALVALPGDGGEVHFAHFQEVETKKDVRARFNMAWRLFDHIQYLSSKSTMPVFVCLEDYDMSPRQQVAYQIAETAGVLKFLLLQNQYTLALIHPRKRQSYVAKTKIVSKDMVIAYAVEKGFSPLPKVRGRDVGFDKRQREDLADGFVMAEMGRELHMFIEEGTPAKKGHIFLDPDYGLAFRHDLVFNHPARSDSGT